MTIVTDEFEQELIFSDDMEKRYKFIISANKNLHSEIVRAYKKLEPTSSDSQSKDVG